MPVRCAYYYLVNIGFHSWEFPPTIVGGLGTYAQWVTAALAARGHQLLVWTPEHPHWPAAVPPVMAGGVEVRRLPLFDATPIFEPVVSEELRSWDGFFSELLVYNLLATGETLQERGLDVIAIQDWLSAMAGLMLAKPRPAPIVFHVHSTEWGRQPGGGSPAVRHLEGAMAYHADAIVTVSEAMKDDLVAHGWDAGKIFVVWNGVDPERYHPGAAMPVEIEAVRRCYELPSDARVLLFVGRLTAVKGVLQLVEAMPAIVAAEPRAHLIILGVGELQEAVAARVRALGLERHVSLRYEFVPESERIAHYAACELAVFPSTYEPFGIVGLEAMAMGKPVVVGARGVVGLREQVIPAGERQTGLHVDGGNPADIAWGVLEALRDPERLRAWGTNARQRVLDHFTWAHTAEKTEAVYQRAVERFRRA